jgi:type III restriction enzyme
MSEIYYKTFENEFAREKLDESSLPDCFTNLKANSRHYQVEGFKRFIYHFTKKNKALPIDLLFQMATGSGKTHMMAGLMLYLFEQGYNKFIFLVNSKNIITKTKENFLNANSPKYLFNKDMQINEVSNFDYVPEKCINIIFTSLQMLSGDLHEPKENKLVLEDLQEKKIVILADEAHHLNSETKAKTVSEKEEVKSWEGAVKKILNVNKENILLQFTATIDMQDEKLLEKYKDKFIYKYDFIKFREDGFSKDVLTLQTTFSETQEEERLFKRTLIALIVNEYRRFIAGDVGLNLKPVVLAKLDTKAKTKGAMEYFLKRMEGLNEGDVRGLEAREGVFMEAMKFFEDKNLISILKQSFNSETVHIATDNEKEDRVLQEMETNKIRIVYDCERLNEGWDVLNLFDIVRLYETRSEAKTVKEAQLIGRGARYFPFVLETEEGKYTRKFDGDLGNKLRILEQMHYHCQKESKYINELNSALIKEGIVPEKREFITMKVKDEFKETEAYKEGRIYVNEIKKRSLERAFESYELERRIDLHIDDFDAKESHILKKEEVISTPLAKSIIKFEEIDKNKIFFAMDLDHFFSFENLKNRFNIKSRNDFLDIVKNLEISVNTNVTSLDIVKKILCEMKERITANYTECEGTEEFGKSDKISNILRDKELVILKEEQKCDVSGEEFMVQDLLRTTGEEKALINFIKQRYAEIKAKCDYFHLIRNEKMVKIYNKKGQGTEPDFILLSKLKNTANDIKLQIFIEPKGDQFKNTDGGFKNTKEGWKQEFLESLNQKSDNNTEIKGIFYNETSEKEFEKYFKEIFNLIH